jgi:hypothetical protein
LKSWKFWNKFTFKFEFVVKLLFFKFSFGFDVELKIVYLFWGMVFGCWRWIVVISLFNLLKKRSYGGDKRVNRWMSVVMGNGTWMGVVNFRTWQHLFLFFEIRHMFMIVKVQVATKFVPNYWRPKSSITWQVLAVEAVRKYLTDFASENIICLVFWRFLMSYWRLRPPLIYRGLKPPVTII